LIDDRQYCDLRYPLNLVGAHLDARTFHPRRTGRANLLALARYSGIPRARVNAVVEAVGIGAVAGKLAGTYSLGMAQRLGIAGVMLGDPATVILDEPVNGLDADGVRWIRGLVRRWAGEGRTVLISSHLMSEMALTADHLLIVGAGRLLADAGVADLVGRVRTGRCLVRSPHAPELRRRLESRGASVDGPEPGLLEVAGLEAAAIGAVAAAHGLELHELTPHRASLEQAYMELTRDSVEYGVAA
jgi:ABC-2 type transport system ATP-binding protein